MKRLLCNTLIIIMLTGVCFNGCFNFSCLSVSNRYSYAEADNWSACDSSDLVTAFRYYCKSRNLALEGSAADALTTFTTTTFNNICSTIGIDPTQLQAELKKTTEGNLGLRFLFSNSGITAYNRIFAEFLQNNDLAVGDTVDNKNIYSGKSYTDDDGNNALLYVVSDIKNNQTDINYILQKGTNYKYSGNDIYNLTLSGNTTVIFNIDSENLTYNIKSQDYSSAFWGNNLYQTSVKGYPVRFATKSNHNSIVANGGTVLTYSNKDSKIHLCSFVYNNDKKNGMVSLYTLSTATPENVDVDITTNNKTINNNVYNNKYTIIYNEGDTYISDDDDEPLPTTPPGGGGDPNPDDPLAPYDPDKQFPDTPDNPTPDPGVHGSPGSDGTITIPDFNFDIPDINWSLDGLQHKFPFSLPFDLYNACKLLNAEPETPELDYTINLVVYDWRVNYDLHWLDPAARVIRIFELLAFVVGLILITRRLIGG